MANPPYDTFSGFKPPRHIMAGWNWREAQVPSGLSSETAAIATTLGRCIVDAPELRQKLVTLLETQDQQRLSEMSGTSEAIVLEAERGLGLRACRGPRPPLRPRRALYGPALRIGTGADRRVRDSSLPLLR